jgi:hypothetical protein
VFCGQSAKQYVWAEKTCDKRVQKVTARVAYKFLPFTVHYVQIRECTMRVECTTNENDDKCIQTCSMETRRDWDYFGKPNLKDRIMLHYIFVG